MSKKTPGLTKRNDIWHINKVIKGKRLYESTGSSDLEEAERYLAQRITEFRGQLIYGERKVYTFIEAATKYLKEVEKKSLDRDAVTFKAVMPYSTFQLLVCTSYKHCCTQPMSLGKPCFTTAWQELLNNAFSLVHSL